MRIWNKIAQFLTVQKPIKCEELSRSVPKRAGYHNAKSEADTIVSLPFGTHQLEDN